MGLRVLSLSKAHSDDFEMFFLLIWISFLVETLTHGYASLEVMLLLIKFLHQEVLD